jgi:hypothetical protein
MGDRPREDRVSAEPSPSHGAMQRWLLEWIGNCKEDELSMEMMVLYQLWYARNEARDQTFIEDPESTARRPMYRVEEWRVSRTDEHVVQSRPPAPKWSPPATGWHKANVDGAMSSDSSHGGGSIVLRDEHGSFMAGAFHFFPSVSDPERSELLACRSVVQLAKNMGISRLMLETDCLGAKAKLVGNELDRSMHGPLVEEIKVLLKSSDDHIV